MATSETTIWGIHGGSTGDADGLFLKHNRIGLGWTAIGDLSKLKGDRDSFKVAVASAYPEKTVMMIANNAGQLFRFVHELKQISGVKTTQIIRHLHRNFLGGDTISRRQFRSDLPKSGLPVAQGENRMAGWIEYQCAFRIEQNGFACDFIHLHAGAR